MGSRLRTILLVVVGTVLLMAVSAPAAGAADLGDLLGLLGGGGGGSPPPQEPSPPPSGPSPSPQPQPGPAAPQSNPIPRQSQLLASEAECPGQTDAGLPAAERTKVMVCMLSHARAAKGRAELRVFKPLHSSAIHKAHDIRRCHVLSHEACGRDAFYWIQRVGFFNHRALAGEILAFGSRQNATALATMRAWLGSDTHRAVILHPGFNLVGVGTARGRIHGFRVTIWVAHLGFVKHR
jgi:uncharacterized protein YkwD